VPTARSCVCVRRLSDLEIADADGSSVSKRVELEVCGIRLENQQGRAALTSLIESNQRNTDAIVRQTAGQTQDYVSARLGDLEASLLNEMAEQHRKYLSNLSEIRDVNEQVNRALARMETSIASMVQPPEDMASLVIDILRRMSTEETHRQIGPMSSRSIDAVVPKAASMTQRDSFRTNNSGSNQSVCPPHTSPLELNSILYITLGRRSPCWRGCPCACHIASRQRSWQLPNFVRNVLGSLLVGYAASPVSPTKCDVERCAKDRCKKLTVTYAFPLWFLNYVIRGVIETSTTGSVTLGLVTCRRIPVEMMSKNILWLVEIGAVDNVRKILRKNRAAVLDVDIRDGSSALHVAVSTVYDWPTQVSLLQCLLTEGADLDLPNDLGITPRHLIARFLLCNTILAEIQPVIERMFPRAEGIKSLELTFLHEIVLGLCGADLTETLRSKDPAIQSQLNTGDVNGFTPLMYAVKLGNEHHVRALIDAGADVNAHENAGHTALFQATSNTVDLLISAGANVNLVDSFFKASALHHAARANETDVMRKLITAGANINQASREGGTPLHHAASRDLSSAISLLYEMGADLNVRDQNGLTPLMYAISNNSHHALHKLLEIKADHLCRDNDGWNFIDFAARYGDVETLKTLASFNLDISTWDDIDSALFDGWYLFENCERISGKPYEAFGKFMDSLETGGRKWKLRLQ
jgi:ankyrin repeat protein